MTAIDTTIAPAPETTWCDWEVAPAFRVADESRRVGLAQFSGKNFAVMTAFEFVGHDALDDLRAQLIKAGVVDDVEAALRDVASFMPGSEGANGTDLASVPRFMRWFVNPYGPHTLAAIVHDRLITSDGPNKGPLRSDVLSDRFFRQMMRAAGVPFLRRWIMWAAVAMRTRWAAAGWRRLTLVTWLALASIGITLGVGAASVLVSGHGHIAGLSTLTMASVALIMPLASSVLWGRQYGASLVAAIAALWILPPAALAVAGYGAYVLLESGLSLLTED